MPSPEALALFTQSLSQHERVGYAAPRDVVVFGATGHARMLKPILDRLNVRIRVLYDRNQDVQPFIPTVPMVRSREAFIAWLAGYRFRPLGAVVAIANPHAEDRLEFLTWLAGFGLPPVTLLHPSAWVEDDVEIGAGSHILARACVGVGVTMGQGCIISHTADVGHDCVLEEGVQIGPGAKLGGGVRVGRCAWVAMGATVRDGVSIGAGATVGMGSVVVKDVPPNVTVMGMAAQLRVQNAPPERLPETAY